MANKKKVLILGNSHLVVFKFRGELIERLIKEDYEVIVCFPNGPFGEGEKSAKQYGCRFIENKIDRRGTNPLKDLLLIFEYYKIIRNNEPDVVLAYTVKPDVYGGIVCRLLDIPFIPNITGLGKGLDEGGPVQIITKYLYRIAIKKAKCVFFQNNSDKLFFERNNITYKKGIVLPGSGVNLKKYKPLPYPDDKEPVRFIFIGRIMKAKGIEEYLEAAHEIKKKYKNVEFHICGFCEEDYKKILEDKVENKEVIYHGLVDDVIEFQKYSHCIVLPSFHPEGISNVLLEGAACSRPLITTDHAGCRETVNDGETGFIIQQQNSKDLIEKIIRFIEMPNSERRKMGLYGREKIEQEFDRNIVVNKYMDILSLI